jgi:hypothetical protein
MLSIDPAFRSKAEQGQLQVIAFDENLSAFFAHCDLFLHLPGFTGGAGGLFMALMAGVPSLCFRNTDAASRVEPGCVFDVNDLDGFMASAKALIDSPGRRKTTGEACERYFNNVGVPELAGLTHDALVEAIEIFNQRVSATPTLATNGTADK